MQHKKEQPSLQALAGTCIKIALVAIILGLIGSLQLQGDKHQQAANNQQPVVQYDASSYFGN